MSPCFEPCKCEFLPFNKTVGGITSTITSEIVSPDPNILATCPQDHHELTMVFRVRNNYDTIRTHCHIGGGIVNLGAYEETRGDVVYSI